MRQTSKMNYQAIFLYVTILFLSISRISAKFIDLSHIHGPNTLMSPHVPSFNRSTIFAGFYVSDVYVEGGQYSSGEHGGTHMDAPVHFQKGGQQVHQIPLENTIADGVMIDCSQEANKSRSYQVPVQKLLDWEKVNGRIPDSAAVLFNFGWSVKFSNPPDYLGGNGSDQFALVFPSVSAEAGAWLFNERHIKIIGSDTYSPDPLSLNGQPIISFPIHQQYLPKGRLIIENVNDVYKLPPRGFRFYAAPVKYLEATGTQIRAFAMTFDEDDIYRNKAGHQTSLGCVFVLFIFIIMTMI